MRHEVPEAAQRPTVSSVAVHAGVSRQTVSNALNNPERLQPDTLKRVLAAIEETGYVRSAAARQMRTARSGVIAYRLDPVRDGIGGAVLDTFLHALTAEAERRDYRVALYTADSDEAELRQFASLTQTRAADAFVLVGTHRNDLRYRWLTEHGVPYSVFGRPWSEQGTAAQPTHAWIDVDGAAGTAQATQHLLDLGHRNIAFVGWPAGSETGDERRRGWDEAMAAAGVTAAERHALDSEQQDGILEGADAASRLLATGATAFVCASDSLAVGAFSAVRAAGERAAVVGFDDTPTAAALGLSSVRQPLDSAAAWALASVLDQLDGRPPRERDARLLLPQLVVRESSQPPMSTR
ncbi:substrate-binding domain-containing protein [Sinomonas sp. ASV322]|uniref:LacI family DNA-binding transcriptional regulator n=1 Tax=Sinomonas sp. ASV322 TaxID=3041920 RepID=UPI0027DD4DEB|nr:substrate-binding domain-containing protein [Sinomonas sp. ASV322]MDQ4504639.1 substrate-binding domain-containing protein [Sinomonas sp. ASV322]